MSGPPLIDIVLYFVAGYLVAPIVGAFLVTQWHGLSTRAALAVTVLGAAVAAPIGYTAVMIIEPRLAGSVLTLTLGPAVSTGFAAAIAYLISAAIAPSPPLEQKDGGSIQRTK